MFAKLALRNVKRQLSNYIIYFVTVTLTVSMMFALCNLIFSEQLQGYAEKMGELQNGLIGVAIAISLVVACVLGYASSFMLRLRKREFGTYLTLGMTRKNVLLMFTVENLLIGFAALACGILFGLLLFQGAIGLIARVLDMKLTFGSYSIDGLFLTVALTAGTFLLSTVSSALYLRRANIYELLHAHKVVSGGSKRPAIWLAVTVLSLIAVVCGILGVYFEIKIMFEPHDFADESSVAGKMFLYMATLFAGVVFYHVGFAKCALRFLIRNNKIKCRGTNAFVLRQLSGQLGANSALCGIIAFLITATVICTNVCFAQKATTETYLDQNFPFDVSLNVSRVKSEAPYSYDRALEIIEAESAIKKSIAYNIYTSGNGYLHSFTPWTGEHYEDLYDSFILESDFNALIESLGLEPVSLAGGCLILSNATYLSRCDFESAVLRLGDHSYTVAKAGKAYPSFSNTYMLAVVPDEAAEHLSVETEMSVFDVENDDLNAQALNDAFTYTIPSGSGYNISRCPAYVRAYYELEENSLTAILIAGELFMAIIFVFLATAILTMKLLSEISDDRGRYELLYKLGSDRPERKNALFRQTLVMFVFPFLLPVLISLPAAYICAQIVAMGGYTSLVSQIYANSGVIAAIISCISLIYFAATYITKKRNVIV